MDVRMKMRSASSAPIAALVILCIFALEATQALQYTHPAYMLLWRSPAVSKKRQVTTPEVVDLGSMVEPIFGASSPVEAMNMQNKKEGFLDYVDPADTNYEWLAGVGPYGLIEITGASTSFNRPLFDYDTLMNAVYQANYQKWANQTGGWDTYDLWQRRSIDKGAARRKRKTDANGYEENWMGRTGVSPFKVTKNVDKVSPKLFSSAFGTNQVGPTPDLFEVLVFFRLRDDARSPYTVIRLHHAILSEYQIIAEDSRMDDDDYVMKEELWFEFARMDYAYAENLRAGCNSGGCPGNPSSVLNCRLGILYDFPYSPVFPGCP